MFLFTFIIAIFFSVSHTHEIEVRCNDGIIATEVKCEFQESGVYRVLGVDTVVTKLIFDRLTNSQVIIPHHVQELTISSSSEFDTFSPCEHLLSTHWVKLNIENLDFHGQCVSMISIFTYMHFIIC